MIKELVVYMLYGSAFISLILLITVIGETIRKIKVNQRLYESKRIALREERLKAIRERNKKKHKKSS